MHYIVTEEEIINGIINNTKANDNSIAIFRKIIFNKKFPKLVIFKFLFFHIVVWGDECVCGVTDGSGLN